MSDVQLYLGDCLEVMPRLPDKSCDMILCDLPYGTTACKWDSLIPLDKLWEQYNRLLRPQGSVLLFGSEPFSTHMRMSNLKAYKYDWIWHKGHSTGFVHAMNMPLKDFEVISVFSNSSMGHKSMLGEHRMIYNPQGLIRYHKERKAGESKFGTICGKRPSHKDKICQEYTNFPTAVLHFKKDTKTVHPTQKPVALLAYLIKTYTNGGGRQFLTIVWGVVLLELRVWKRGVLSSGLRKTNIISMWLKSA